jgi:phosphatidylglycerol lysyltransferase
VLALPDAGKAEVLSAVLIYRAIYYVLPVVVATVGLGLIELRSFLYRIAPPSSPPRTLLYAAAPPLIAALTFASGIVLLFSSATPALQSRIEILKNFVPMPFVEVSHLLASIIGFALLVLASGLNHRLDGAWVITVFLLAVGIVVSLLKGLDFEEATILAIMLVVVLLARPAFYRSSSLLHDRPSRFVLITIVLAVAASIWVTFLAFADVPYTADLWWQVAWNAQAPRSIRAGLIVSVLTVIYALWLVLRPSRPRLADDDLMPVIRRIVAASANPDSNLALTGDKHFLVSDSGDAFLMYSVQGRSWVAMSDPVGNPAAFDKLLWTYLEIVDQFGGRPIFYEITAAHLPLYLDLGLSLMKIGEEATVDLTTFSLEGSARANLRRAVRRAEREQLIFDVIAKESVTPILPELQAVSNAWLSEKRGREKAFSVGRFSREYLLLFDQAVVRQDGDIIAFANIWQSAGDGLSVDLMRYKPGTPNGLMDFLFCRLMLWGHAQGFKKFSLGMAPLAGLQKHALAPTWHKAGNLLFEYGEELYGLAGLRAYKDKFRPVWQPRYLAVPGGLSLPSVILDLIVLISRPRRIDLGPAPSIRSASA